MPAASLFSRKQGLGIPIHMQMPSILIINWNYTILVSIIILTIRNTMDIEMINKENKGIRFIFIFCKNVKVSIRVARKIISRNALPKRFIFICFLNESMSLLKKILK